MSGLGALKKFGEALMRKADAGDPRLRRALDMGFDLENPLVHGTRGDLKGDPRQLFMARDPDLALLYTGGGRRGGVGTPAKNPSMFPVLTNSPTVKSPFGAFDDVTLNNYEALEGLGIPDPKEFRARVREANALKNEEYLRNNPHFNTDDFFGTWMTINPELDQKVRFYSLLDNEAFRNELRKLKIPPIEFAHDYALTSMSPKGRVKFLNQKAPGTAIFAHDPSVLRSPWAAFEEEGVGLLKKKGGLMQVHKCGCEK